MGVFYAGLRRHSREILRKQDLLTVASTRHLS
jgi:hypothetical protein